MAMDKEVEDLIKDLYKYYSESHVDQQEHHRAVCISCFAFTEYDKQKDEWPKIKHHDDCDVVKMRKRIRAILEKS
jgi:hypothetical protein